MSHHAVLSCFLTRRKFAQAKVVSLDGDPIMETKQVCDDSPGEVDSVGESAIWTAQQGTHNPCQKSNSVIQCVQRTAAITKPLTCRRVVTSPSGQVKARLTTRGNEQAVRGHQVVTLERFQPLISRLLLVLAATFGSRGCIR